MADPMNDRPDCAVEITTRSGSRYRFDPEERTVTWRDGDGRERCYTAITDLILMVDYPFYYAGTRDLDGKPNTRRTTPVVSIEPEASRG